MKFDLSKIDKVKKLKVSHRMWSESLEMAYIHLLSASAGDLIAITGPSRAGKSELVEELGGLFNSSKRFNENGLMPFVAIEAENDGQYGAFSTKSLILRLLEEIQHPIFGTEEFQESQKVTRSSEKMLRTGLVRFLKLRKTKYLVIDEAQHIRYAGKDVNASIAVLDSWKCLAKRAGVVLVVVGAYPLLEVIRNSRHLIGRKSLVDMSRYKNNLEDLKEFAAIVQQYGGIIGEAEIFLDNLEILHVGSLGCIGLLKRWLLDVLKHCEVMNQEVSREVLIDVSSTDDDLKELLVEIVDGEKLLESNIFEKYTKVRKSTRGNSPRAKKKYKPGKRKPARLKIDGCVGGANV